MSPSLVVRFCETISCSVGCAAEQAEEVEESLRQVAGLAVEVERDRVLALGDFGLVGVAQERHVPEARDLPAEGFVEQDVFGRGTDPLLGADDVGDVHEVVVDDVSEVVGGEAVGLHEDLIVDVIVIEGDVAAEFVFECGGRGLWDFEADGVVAAFADVGGYLFGREFAVGAVVARGLLGGDLRLAHRFQLFGSFKRTVGVAGC